MALTTVVKGRSYDWSHAIGRGAANGTGFNYPQTMCLGNDGDLYVANRGNENNFGMRVNRIKVGGPGDEELLSEFCTYGETDGHGHAGAETDCAAVCAVGQGAGVDAMICLARKIFPGGRVPSPAG